MPGQNWNPLIFAAIAAAAALALGRRRRKSKFTIAVSSSERTMTTSDGKIFHAELVEFPIQIPSAKELMAQNLGRYGAIATFEGVTRNFFQGKVVTELEYEAYPSMALAKMLEIMKETSAIFHDVEKIVIIHRLGPCPSGETSLFIATLSAHRAPALAALPVLVDALKAKVPIWKLEKYEDDDKPAEWKENAEWDPNLLKH